MHMPTALVGRLSATRPRVQTLAAMSAGLAAAAFAIAPSTAPAVSGAGCATVHVGPEASPGAPPASYFILTVKPGARVTARLLLANPEPYGCTVTLSSAYGKTAVDSGDSYPIPGPSPASCTRTSCWVSALPPRVTIPGNSRVSVPFTVRVPDGTPAGEYLAGIVAGPGTPPAPPRLGRRRSMVGAAVVSHVALGVAITVPGRLAPALTIPSVTLNATPTSAVLSIVERDRGNTWEHPHGQVLIATTTRVGRLGRAAHSGAEFVTLPLENNFGVRSQTILPGDAATLPLPIGVVSHGTWPTVVKLWYDHDRKVAIWRGNVTYPFPRSVEPATALYGDPPGPSEQLPLWAKLVIGVLGLLSCGLAGLLLIVLFRRRRRRES